MKITTPIPLAKATALANKIVQEILPYCHKIAIAGSIRRQRPYCGDIDLVVLPKPGQLVSLQGRFKQKAFVITEGLQNAMYQLQNGVQIDVFFAQEKSDMFEGQTTNWGTLLLCRTGSKEFNMHLSLTAKAAGLAWHPYIGVLDANAKTLASATEEDVFQALGLPFVEPQNRER